MPTTFAGFVDIMLATIDALVGGVFALLFVYMIWKTIDSWIINAGEPGKREEGRKTALLAVLMMFLMLTTWAVVTVIRSTLSDSF